MIRSGFFLVLFSWLSNPSNGQSIWFGQSAYEIKNLVEWTTRDRYGYDSYGNSKGGNVVYDVKYYDGHISEVIQCYRNQYLIDFRMSASFCKHYLMENEILYKIVTQYENISQSELINVYDNLYGNRKIEGRYYSEDFNEMQYIKLINGMASVIKERVDSKYLPGSVKKIKQAELDRIQKENKLKEARNFQKEIEDEIKREKEAEYKKNCFDLRKHDNNGFHQFKLNVSNEVISSLKSCANNQNKELPSFEYLKANRLNNLQVKGAVKVHYRQIGSPKSVDDSEFSIFSGTGNGAIGRKVRLISGDQRIQSIVNNTPVILPSLSVDGFTVRSEAVIDTMPVNYVIGFNVVKVKNGRIKVKKDVDSMTYAAISSKFTGEKDGKYRIKYSVIDVMGLQVVELSKKKVMTTGGIIGLAGGLTIAGGGTIGALIYYKLFIQDPAVD